jgi:hypothetical protein
LVGRCLHGIFSSSFVEDDIQTRERDDFALEVWKSVPRRLKPSSTVIYGTGVPVPFVGGFNPQVPAVNEKSPYCQIVQMV